MFRPKPVMGDGVNTPQMSCFCGHGYDVSGCVGGEATTFHKILIKAMDLLKSSYLTGVGEVCYTYSELRLCLLKHMFKKVYRETLVRADAIY